MQKAMMGVGERASGADAEGQVDCDSSVGRSLRDGEMAGGDR